MIKLLATVLVLAAPPVHAAPKAVLIEPKAAFALAAEHKQDPGFVVLDVRTPDEYAAGHLAGSVNFDFTAKDFQDKLAGLDKTKTYLVHCAKGGRSAKAAKSLSRLGFGKVYDLKGGYDRWAQEGLPTTK